MFNLQTSVLYIFRKNMKVTWFSIVHIALFAGSAAILVPYKGFVGYGWAEIIALPSYVIIHLFLAREIDSPSYGAPAIWYAMTVCVLLLGSLGAPARYFAFVILFTPLFFRKERSTLAGYAKILFSKDVT
jgi:PST family polysaccharide transporter